MKSIIACTGLVALLALPGFARAEAVGGSMDPATTVSGSGNLAGPPLNIEVTLTAFGSVPQFNVFGAVLQSYTINGRLVLTSSSSLEIQADNTSADLSVYAKSTSNDDLCSLTSIGTDSCSASSSDEFSIPFSSADFSSVLGTGTVPVSRDGIVGIGGGCFAGTNPDGNCSQVFWDWSASAVLTELRVEWAYCTTPGVDGCPDLVLGVNSPRQGDAAVPEPITLALFGVGLTGLAVSRRIRPKRRS